MSPQHDYIIDNSTGANVRADINSVLQAISSNNSGSSAPSTTYALQSFANTTDSMLQLRNAANNAFVNLRKFDGTLPLPDGSVSSPSLFFDDDTNTGIFSSAADTFNVATGGVERMELGATTIFNESGADVDFRIEGDTNANLFYVDAGNDRIGVGTATPRANFDVTGNIFASNGAQIQITGSSGAKGLQLIGQDDGTSLIGTMGSSGEDLLFRTASTERMRIDTSGRVLIGTTSGSDALVVDGGSDAGTITTNSTNSNGNMMTFNCSGTGKFFIGSAGSFMSGHSGTTNQGIRAEGALAIATGGTTERMRIDSSGNVGIGTASPSETLTVTKGSGDLVKFSRTGTGNSRVLTLQSGRATGSTTANTVTFENGSGTVVGTIQNNVSSTSFNTSSDYRLKENVTAISDGITRLKTLKPYRFNFKADSSTTVDGFLAHEVTAVPEAITGTKDEVDSDNNPVYQGIDQSKLVPLLVAAVQELIGKVEALEAA